MNEDVGKQLVVSMGCAQLEIGASEQFFQLHYEK